MSDNFQQMDGVGPAREGNLKDAGFETFSDLAEADPDDVHDQIPNTPEDTALELVVQAQNIVDLEETEDEPVESEPGLVEEVEEELDEELEELEEEMEEIEEEVAEEEDGKIELSLDLSEPLQHDTFFYTIYDQRNHLLKTNRDGKVEPYENMLEEIRTSKDGQVSVSLESQELHDFHNAIRSKEVEFQGDNLIDQMEAIKQVKVQLNEVREEKLF